MSKMKTHKASSKRFKYTASGKVKRGRAGNSHLAPGKTQKRKRNLRKSAIVSPGDYKRIKQQITYTK